MKEARLVMTRISVKKDYLRSLDDVIMDNKKYISYKVLVGMVKQYKDQAIEELIALEDQLSVIKMRLNSIDDDTLKYVLKSRFIENKKVSLIAEEMYMTEQWIYELINRGLEKYSQTSNGAD